MVGKPTIRASLAGAGVSKSASWLSAGDSIFQLGTVNRTGVADSCCIKFSGLHVKFLWYFSRAILFPKLVAPRR